MAHFYSDNPLDICCYFNGFLRDRDVNKYPRIQVNQYSLALYYYPEQDKTINLVY